MNLSQLPDNLPPPQDDGAANHLQGKRLPNITLATITGDNISLAQLNGLTVLFAYPMTGRSDTPLPSGWDDIPGARGCTPQSCAFRDLYSEFNSVKRRSTASAHNIVKSKRKQKPSAPAL